MELVSLQLQTTNNFKQNLQKLIKEINNSPDYAVILLPELYLTGYAYNKMDNAVSFGLETIPILKKLSTTKTIAITLITKKKDNYFNTLHIFHKGAIVHTQSKAKLFVLNDERVHFTAGDEKDIKIIDIYGIKVATLICFELRYIELWKKIQGADVVLIPAMWGLKRKQHFEILTQALAVANQCFVIASDSANDDMAKSSAIISPFGDVTKDDGKKLILCDANFKEIKKMRRYLNIGIK